MSFSNHKRLIILGNTGNGKSSFIKLFNSGLSDEQKLLLIDTPGIGSLNVDQNTIENELKNAISICSPGPHLFIIVLTCQRFLISDKETIDFLCHFYGKEIFNYSILLFTRIEDLEYDNMLLDEYIYSTARLLPDFQKLIDSCKQRYLGFSNRWKSNDPKLIEFKCKFINTMNELIQSSDSKNEIYSIEMFETFQINYKNLKEQKIHENKEILEEEVEKLKNKIKMDLYYIAAREISNLGI